MSINVTSNQKSPIRVVLFGGGPILERSVKQFIGLLETHPQIDFLGGFCQSEAQTFKKIVADLWRRRRLLAVPLLLLQFGKTIGHYLFQPRQEIRLNRIMKQVSDRIHFSPDIHAEEILAKVRALSPDLGLIYSSPILKPTLFEIPRYGTLGIHHGKLPEYRGKKTTFWAIYNGEEVAGVTIQKVNSRLDSGEIVKEGNVPINGRSLRAVWKDLETLGFDLYFQAILNFKQVLSEFHPQTEKKGKLYRDPKLKDILVFWGKQLFRKFKIDPIIIFFF
jgi:folate-dependent phosphoribosylglycinamide formyltransferase PurN